MAKPTNTSETHTTFNNLLSSKINTISWNEWLINHKKRFNPTENQQRFLNYIESTTITICYGVSGSGKTLMSCWKALDMLMNNRIKRIIVTRPIVECGEKLGFLPGSFEEKINPYMLPITDYFGDFLGKKELEKFIKEGIIEMVPIALIRGRNFHNAFVIGDELQNCTYGQLKCLLTRTGQNCRMVLIGDVEQSDLILKKNEEIPFLTVINKLYNKHPDIKISYMTDEDILRNELIKIIVKEL